MAVTEQLPIEVLVEHHAPLADRVVASVAASRLPRHVARDDLRSAALEALYQAARRFDPALGVPFEGYALCRMRGAVIDELRAADWATRTTRSRVNRIEEAAERLSQELGRAPYLEEIADAVGLAPTEVRGVEVDRQRATVLQLDALTPQGGDLPIEGELPGPESELLEAERGRLLGAAIDALSPRQSAVIRGYYLDGRKAKDIAVDFGVTESRVCQIRAEGIKALRSALRGSDLETN